MPLACSGDMYAAVRKIVPAIVAAIVSIFYKRFYK
jgi:hypothetical protein